MVGGIENTKEESNYNKLGENCNNTVGMKGNAPRFDFDCLPRSNKCIGERTTPKLPRESKRPRARMCTSSLKTKDTGQMRHVTALLTTLTQLNSSNSNQNHRAVTAKKSEETVQL